MHLVHRCISKQHIDTHSALGSHTVDGTIGKHSRELPSSVLSAGTPYRQRFANARMGKNKQITHCCRRNRVSMASLAIEMVVAWRVRKKTCTLTAQRGTDKRLNELRLSSDHTGYPGGSVRILRNSSMGTTYSKHLEHVLVAYPVGECLFSCFVRFPGMNHMHYACLKLVKLLDCSLRFSRVLAAS